MGVMRPARSMQARWRARQRHLELARELAAYSTPAERRDFEAILDRYPDDITYELRDILASQAMAVSGKPDSGRRTLLKALASRRTAGRAREPAGDAAPVFEIAVTEAAPQGHVPHTR